MKEKVLTYCSSIGCQNRNKTDDLIALSKLDGITPSMQRWLRKSFNINSVEELTQISVNTLVFRLEEEGKCCARDEVESWMAQAQELVAQKSPWQTSANFVVSLQSRSIGDQIEHRTTVYFIEADRKAIWPGIEFNGIYELMREHLKHSYWEEVGEAVGTYSVPQSRSKVVRYRSEDADFSAEMALNDLVLSLSELDQSSKLVSEILPQPDANEISDHSSEENVDTAPDEVPETIEAEAITPDKEAETTENVKAVAEEGQSIIDEELPEEEVGEPLNLEIIQIKLYLPVDAKTSKAGDSEAKKNSDKYENVMVFDAAKRLILGQLPKNKPFDLEVIFNLTGPRALELTTRSIPYRIELFGRNRTTRQKLILGNAPVGHLVNGELTYTSRLSEVSLPEGGTYRLQVIARLENAPVGPDFLELPYVQVA